MRSLGPRFVCLFQPVPGGIVPSRFANEALDVRLAGVYCEPGAARMPAPLAWLRHT
jgi:hypothetical protein